jgi:hypothetical protein
MDADVTPAQLADSASVSWSGANALLVPVRHSRIRFPSILNSAPRADVGRQASTRVRIPGLFLAQRPKPAQSTQTDIEDVNHTDEVKRKDRSEAASHFKTDDQIRRGAEPTLTSDDRLRSRHPLSRGDRAACHPTSDFSVTARGGALDHPPSAAIGQQGGQHRMV